MAISIYEEWGFTDRRINDFLDEESGQLDPCLAAFKRIVSFPDFDNTKEIIEDLWLVDYESFRIDSLRINKYQFDYMREYYKDKQVNLIIQNLELLDNRGDYFSDEAAEFINQISPKVVNIETNKCTVECIKALTLLNCANVSLNFIFQQYEESLLCFNNTLIQLFEDRSNKMLTFESELINLSFIEEDGYEKNRIEEVKLLKANNGNFLFIPLDTILYISCSGFKEILNVDDISKQFADLSVQYQLQDSGLIIPMGYSNKMFIKIDDDNLDSLNQYKDIYQMFKEKHIELKISNFRRLLEIKKLYPDDISRINFKYIDIRSKKFAEYSISKIKDDPDCINLKFKEIYKFITLSPDEFQFWCNVLRSRRTRFNLTTINLGFSLLSECLTVLSLCSDCPQLESVDLRYLEADSNNVDEVIKQAKKDFRKKFGFIQSMNIWKI